MRVSSLTICTCPPAAAPVPPPTLSAACSCASRGLGGRFVEEHRETISSAKDGKFAFTSDASEEFKICFSSHGKRLPIRWLLWPTHARRSARAAIPWRTHMVRPAAL